MRAKYINEKFVKDSDPISDMDIGMEHLIKKFVKSIYPYAKESSYLWICAKEGKTDFVKYLLDAGANVHEDDDNALCRSAG